MSFRQMPVETRVPDLKTGEYIIDGDDVMFMFDAENRECWIMKPREFEEYKQAREILRRDDK